MISTLRAFILSNKSLIFHRLKSIFALVFLAFYDVLSAQVFDPGSIQMLVQRGAHHIYNVNPDSTHYYISEVENLIPDHPVIPLMEAMNLLWVNMPIISEDVFSSIETQLDSVILLAKIKDPKLETPEMIFFAMSAYGLLAEYYADQGYTLKAVGEANRAYRLLKQVFDLTEEYPEFLFITGLYNYFREKYPEKYPIYSPLLWFFRSGNLNLGLQQLEQVAKEAFFDKG